MRAKRTSSDTLLITRPVLDTCSRPRKVQTLLAQLRREVAQERLMGSAEPVHEDLINQQFELERPTWRFQARRLLGRGGGRVKKPQVCAQQAG